MFSVYQPWDPLQVCVVGRSYAPEFYSFIKNPRLRSLFEKIATETEEDFQQLILTLKKFGVSVVRPEVPAVPVEEYITSQNRIPGPISMNPRDQMIMIGNKFYVFPYDYISIKSSGRTIPKTNWNETVYHQLKGPDWPEQFIEYNLLPEWIKSECKDLLGFEVAGENHREIFKKTAEFAWWAPITTSVEAAGNPIFYNTDYRALNQIPTNGITRIGRDLYFGVKGERLADAEIEKISQEFFSDYRCHFVTTGGHIDGCFTPVKPGLIVSIEDMATYEKTFPGWEVVYLKGESWSKVQPFLDLKKQNQGRWWIKGSEYDTELINYVETWLRDWVGYVEESVFDVNILVIDQKNIIVNGYNKIAFDAFERHGITAHICPIRHRYFWDGGVHCVTLDLDRIGIMQDFFPERSMI